MNGLKSILLIGVLGLFMLSANGQDDKPKLYEPMSDAKKDISEAVKIAKAENKHVFIQVGGNW
jgi:hypothetical protein